MRIYLIGMPGIGKSTLGKVLAKQLNYEFIDMDQYIEMQACMFVDEIFDAYGEEHFRALERNTLTEFLHIDNIVIATGGGIIKNKQNKELLQGLCVYLTADLKDISSRLAESGIVRPLLKDNKLEELYIQRKDLYEYFSDLTVDNTNMDKAIERIMEAVQ